MAALALVLWMSFRLNWIIPVIAQPHSLRPWKWVPCDPYGRPILTKDPTP